MTAESEKIGLPPRPFLYSLDQISTILSVQRVALKSMVFFEGRSVGLAPKDRMIARNIAGPNDPPVWRVAEKELIRWMKVKGFKFYERSSVTR